MEEVFILLNQWLERFDYVNSVEQNLSESELKKKLATVDYFNLTGSMLKALDNHWKITLEYLFKHLINLRELTLELIDSQHIIDNIPFKFLNNIVNISFVRCNIQNLPEGLYELNSLESLIIELSLKGNGIQANIDKLQKLQYLHIYSDELTNIPVSIGSLDNLRNLIIVGKKINHLPNEIGDIKALETLYIKIHTNFPQEISQLKSLRSLSLDIWLENKNEQEFSDFLRDIILPLNQLESLSLKSNCLRNIPSWMSKLNYLKGIRLAGLEEENLPIMLREFINLESLSITESYLNNIPSWISELYNLVFIDFTDTQITDLPPSFFKLKKLKKLTLAMMLMMEEVTLEKIKQMLPNTSVIY